MILISMAQTTNLNLQKFAFSQWLLSKSRMKAKYEGVSSTIKPENKSLLDSNFWDLTFVTPKRILRQHYRHKMTGTSFNAALSILCLVIISRAWETLASSNATNATGGKCLVELFDQKASGKFMVQDSIRFDWNMSIF